MPTAARVPEVMRVMFVHRDGAQPNMTFQVAKGKSEGTVYITWVSPQGQGPVVFTAHRGDDVPGTVITHEGAECDTPVMEAAATIAAALGMTMGHAGKERRLGVPPLCCHVDNIRVGSLMTGVVLSLHVETTATEDGGTRTTTARCAPTSTSATRVVTGPTLRCDGADHHLLILREVVSQAASGVMSLGGVTIESSSTGGTTMATEALQSTTAVAAPVILLELSAVQQVPSP